MIKKTLGNIILLLATATCVGQSLNTAKMDSLLHAFAAADKGMGSLTLSVNGLPVYQQAIGYSAIAGTLKTEATIKTRYRIGSITKVFTGVMIFQLIEEGKLSLATKLSTFFPQITNADKISIEMMLSHHSGLHNFTADGIAYMAYHTQAKTQAEMLAIIAATKPNFEPGTKEEYSNTNFLLLGYIIEKLTKESYAEALKQRITSKAGLRDTYYGGKIKPQNNEAFSYTYKGSWLPEAETDMSVPGGAGAIVATPADLAKFIEALFAGRFINAEHLKLMQTIKDGYGMAMFSVPFGGKRGYGHNGSIDGFTSVLYYFPDDKLTVAWCSNGMNYNFNDILIGILSIYYKLPYKIPAFSHIVLSAADLDKYLGTYSSAQIPLKLTVSKDGNALMAQATGQSAFALQPTAVDVFEFAAAGVVMEFKPAAATLVLKQGGQVFNFTRDK